MTLTITDPGQVFKKFGSGTFDRIVSLEAPHGTRKTTLRFSVSTEHAADESQDVNTEEWVCTFFEEKLQEKLLLGEALLEKRGHRYLYTNDGEYYDSTSK